MAGGPITVTDRISVRVTAKNQEQSNSQKRDVGGSIAKTLGNGNVSDSLKDQLGNTKNPVITDENGDTWVSEEDVIDAGKAMNTDGAFEEKRSVIVNGTKYTMIGSPMIFPNGETYLGHMWANDEAPIYAQIDESTTAVYGGIHLDDLTVDLRGTIYATSQNYFRYYVNGSMRGASKFTLNGETIYYAAWVAGIMTVPGYEITGPDFYPEDVNNFAIAAWAYFYGEQTGDSLIDWTKPDNEIDPQIHELFETMRTMDGKDYVKVAIATESGSGDSGSGGGHTGGDF